MEVLGNVLAVARLRAGVAPALPGAVIGTHTRSLCYFRLNEKPAEYIAAALFEDDAGVDGR
jgi:hypothetical protein